MTFEVASYACGSIIGTIGLVLALLSDRKRSWRKRAGIGALVLAIVAFVLPFLLHGSLTIVSPRSGSVVSSAEYTIRDYNSKQLVTVPIGIKGKGLPKGKFVTLMTADAGGSRTWVNGGSTPSDLVGENGFQLDNATFGEQTDGKGTYYCYLVLTDGQLNPGEVFDNNKLPPADLKSDTVMLRIQK